METNTRAAPKFEDSDFGNYSLDALQFAFDQSSIMLEETFQSFRSAGTRSDVALGIYIGVFCFMAGKLADGQSINPTPFVIIMIGMLVCILLATINLFPGKMVLPGTEPKNLIDPFYLQEGIKNEQHKQMLISKLIGHNTAIDENLRIVDLRNRLLAGSVIAALATFLITILQILFHKP